MAHLLAWMKGIVLLFFVFSALLYFVPRNVYKKYIRFFMEMTLILALVYPLIRVVFKENALERLIDYDEFWQEMENLQMDVGYLEEEQNAYYREECERNMQEDVERLANECGYEAEEIEVTLTSTYDIEKISLVIKKVQEEADSSVLKQKILECYQMDEKKLECMVR